MEALRAVAGVFGFLVMAAGGWVGYQIARRIQIDESAVPGISGSLAAVWIWSIRAFVFLIVMVGASFPIILLFDAVLGSR